MKRYTTAIMILAWILFSCQTNSSSNTMDITKIKDEILSAETNFLSAFRNGEIKKGAAFHLNSPGYRHIWGGDVRTYQQQIAKLEEVAEIGIKSIDFNVQDRTFKIINSDNVLETLTATEQITMPDESVVNSSVEIISILWQRIDTNWQVGYIHASEQKKEK